MYIIIYIQWNLRIMDTLGTSICLLFGGCPFVGGRNVWTVNGRGKQFVHCREVVLLSECPLSEVLLCMHLAVSLCVSFNVIYIRIYIYIIEQ